MEDELLRAEEVAERCKVSKTKIYRAVRAGRFPPPRKFGRTSLWRASEVEAWANGLRPRAVGGAP